MGWGGESLSFVRPTIWHSCVVNRDGGERGGGEGGGVGREIL